MALNITWTDTNVAEDGYNVYIRDTPMTWPGDVPAPVVTNADTTSYAANVDTTVDQYVIVTAVKGGIEVAAEQLHFVPSSGGTADFTNAQIGDAIGGGIYAGVDTIGGTAYHIVAGDAASEAVGLQWKTSLTTTAGTSSATDGLANTLAMEAAGLANHPAAAHCLAYTGGGHSDWHMPARSQATLMYNNLRGHAEFVGNVSSGDYTWSSTEHSSSHAWFRRFSDGTENVSSKDSTIRRVRPVRRVAV